MAHYVRKDALSSPQMQHFYTITKVLPVLEHILFMKNQEGSEESQD